jgi:hypothetical protein
LPHSTFQRFNVAANGTPAPATMERRGPRAVRCDERRSCRDARIDSRLCDTLL